MTLKLAEDTLAKLQTKINVVMQIDRTDHAADRQARHDTYIDDSEIKRTLDKSIPKIAYALLFNRMDIGDSVLIRDSKTNLNIIGALHQKSGMIDLVIITVMRKKDFKPKKNTKTITL